MAIKGHIMEGAAPDPPDPPAPGCHIPGDTRYMRQHSSSHATVSWLWTMDVRVGRVELSRFACLFPLISNHSLFPYESY